MKKRVILTVLVIILILLLILWIIRFLSPRQLDDVSPLIPCEKSLIDKSQVLYIIPKFNNVSLNPGFCERILALNKTLELHGVYHTYNEFLTTRNQEYLNEGTIIFQECFNQSPTRFKPPQLAINSENKKLIKMNMKLDYILNQLFHKVYHCQDTGRFSNRFQDLF